MRCTGGHSNVGIHLHMSCSCLCILSPYSNPTVALLRVSVLPEHNLLLFSLNYASSIACIHSRIRVRIRALGRPLAQSSSPFASFISYLCLEGGKFSKRRAYVLFFCCSSAFVPLLTSDSAGFWHHRCLVDFIVSTLLSSIYY